MMNGFGGHMMAPQGGGFRGSPAAYAPGMSGQGGMPAGGGAQYPGMVPPQMAAAPGGMGGGGFRNDLAQAIQDWKARRAGGGPPMTGM